MKNTPSTPLTLAVRVGRSPRMTIGSSAIFADRASRERRQSLSQQTQHDDQKSHEPQPHGDSYSTTWRHGKSRNRAAYSDSPRALGLFQHLGLDHGGGLDVRIAGGLLALLDPSPSTAIERPGVLGPLVQDRLIVADALVEFAAPRMDQRPAVEERLLAREFAQAGVAVVQRLVGRALAEPAPSSARSGLGRPGLLLDCSPGCPCIRADDLVSPSSALSAASISSQRRSGCLSASLAAAAISNLAPSRSLAAAFCVRASSGRSCRPA